MSWSHHFQGQQRIRIPAGGKISRGPHHIIGQGTGSPRGSWQMTKKPPLGKGSAQFMKSHPGFNQCITRFCIDFQDLIHHSAIHHNTPLYRHGHAGDIRAPCHGNQRHPGAVSHLYQMHNLVCCFGQNNIARRSRSAWKSCTVCSISCQHCWIITDPVTGKY